jgi:hypothetical protein
MVCILVPAAAWVVTSMLEVLGAMTSVVLTARVDWVLTQLPPAVKESQVDRV